MAEDDDEILDEEATFDPDAVEEEADPEEAELDEDAIDPDDEFGGLGEDDEYRSGEDDLDEDDDADDSAAAPSRTRVAGEDEDEDDDLLAPDDVEADLDTILKDRLVTAEENQDEDDEQEPDDPRTDPGDRLQPKRPDEIQCSTCYLLVRTKAPGCPMGDDNCPIFT